MSKKYLVGWVDAGDHWAYSTDGGATWDNLDADDPGAPHDAIDEASDVTGVPSNEWGIDPDEEV